MLDRLGQTPPAKEVPKVVRLDEQRQRTRLAANRWHDSRVQFRAYKGRLSPFRPRRDDHGHRRTEALARADRRGTRTSRSPRIRLKVDGAGVEPVAGYGASPAPFPQFLPRWARAEALDRPTGTTVAALDARRRVPRRPDVVQLDAGEIAENDRVPLGGRVRSRPRPCSWSTCPARPTTESPQLVDVSGLDRGPAAGRRAPVVTPKNPAQGPRRA